MSREIFPSTPTDERERAPISATLVLSVCHGRRLSESAPRELPEHGDAGFAEGGERPGGPTELGREPTVSHVQQPSPHLQNRYEPTGRLHAEGGGERLLEQGAPGHDGSAVLFGQPGAGPEIPSSSASMRSSARRVTSIAAVSTMSWLVAPLWT